MLAIRRAFGEVARRNRLNLYGEHGHGGERYSENELLHVNLRRLSNRTARHGGLGLYSIVARQTARLQCTRQAQLDGRQQFRLAKRGFAPNRGHLPMICPTAISGQMFMIKISAST
jgi:hypothetical protein